MKIGNVALKNPLVLAPMAGITELPLRVLAKMHGCALVVSEMISANGLVYGAEKTMELLKTTPAERPLCVQIFGAEPAIMRDAAQIVEDRGADLVDINVGCSVKKIVRQGAGAALMREPRQFQAVVKAVRSRLNIPLTIKIRLGWDTTGDQAVAVCRIAQDEGVDAVTVHPRTAQQGFRGTADWKFIGRLKKTLAIPVVGNGDVRSADDILKMRCETGCDAVMIGRAAIGNPWIFSQALALMGGCIPEMPDFYARQEETLRYMDHMVQHFGEIRAVRMMRSRLPWFVKGLPGAAAFRNGIIRTETAEAMKEAIQRYFSGLFRQ